MPKKERSLENAGSYMPNGAYSLYGSVPIRTVDLPEVTIYGDINKYRNKQTEAWKDRYFRPIVNLLGLDDDNYVDSYKNATVPYGQGLGHERDNIIQVKNGVAGQMDRLGMYGAVKGDDGYYKFRNPNYVDVSKSKTSTLEELRKELGFSNNTEFLLWCAENANRLNSAMGKPTAGNAWTRHGIYGDSVIIQSPAKKADYNRRFASSLAKEQGKYVADNIDKHELQTGDIVDIHFKGSDYKDRAFREGDENRTNSHTGTILRTGKDKEHTYVVHKLGPGLQVQPIGELLGSGFFKKSYITGIRRPAYTDGSYSRSLHP